MMAAPLAIEDEIDEIDGGVRQTLENRTNFNRKPSPTSRSKPKSVNNGKTDAAAIPLVNKRGSKPELESEFSLN